MTESRRRELEQMLDEAESAGDASHIESVRRTMNREYRECTSHTADRIKRVEQKIDVIERNQYEMMEELKSWKERANGATWVIRCAYAAAMVGGGMLAIKVIKFLGLY